MTAGYTPTTAEARNAYQHSVMVSEPEMRERMGREFDRWLAARDRAVKAEALREAATEVRASGWWADGSDNYASKVRGWLEHRADRIEKGADA